MNKTRQRRATRGMRGEYDFSAGVRGKYASRFEEGSNVVVLAPDVAAKLAAVLRLSRLSNSRSVNRALRAFLALVKKTKRA